LIPRQSFYQFEYYYDMYFNCMFIVKRSKINRSYVCYEGKEFLLDNDIRPGYIKPDKDFVLLSPVLALNYLVDEDD
jgi:hypothetical protein